MIKSFGDKRTAALFAGYSVKGLPDQIQRRGRAKLLALDAQRFVHAPASGGYVRIDSLERAPYATGFSSARRVADARAPP